MSSPSPIRFEPQLRDGYCLPACRTMALKTLGLRVTQQRLAQLLATNEAGTPFSRVTRLTTFGVTVEYGLNGTLAHLNASHTANTVIIAAIHAAWLPYARIASPHAVIVTSIASDTITVLDPTMTSAPIAVPINAWFAAWIEMEQAYAVVKK